MGLNLIEKGGEKIGILDPKPLPILLKECAWFSGLPYRKNKEGNLYYWIPSARNKEDSYKYKEGKGEQVPAFEWRRRFFEMQKNILEKKIEDLENSMKVDSKITNTEEKLKNAKDRLQAFQKSGMLPQHLLYRLISQEIKSLEGILRNYSFKINPKSLKQLREFKVQRDRNDYWMRKMQDKLKDLEI